MKQFLWVNGYQFTVSEKEAEDYTVSVVVDKPETAKIAEWIEIHSSIRKR